MIEPCGKCMDLQKAVEFFEILPDGIPDETKSDTFCEEYETALNTFRYAASRLIEKKPNSHKGRSINDYYTCSACGVSVSIHNNFCPGCGRRIKWDGCRCLTGCRENDEKKTASQIGGGTDGIRIAGT